jgi:Putative MetA-pathway of phenol degradation
MFRAIRFAPWWPGAIISVFTLGARAAADEGAANQHCAGTYRLASPLPDACLAVIDTDRPHQTDTPHVVPAGHAQFESAVAAVQIGGLLGAAPGERGPHVVLFEDNYKFGVVSGVELQLLFKHAEYATDQRRLVPPGPLQVRAKLNVVEEHGFVPAVTLVPWIFVPFARSQALRGGPLVFWGWELPAHLELEVNAGALFGTKPKAAAAIVLASAMTYTVVGNLRVFIDVYGTGWDVALGTGALWAFTRDMQLDLGTYLGLSGDEPKAAPFLGFSIRR